jgi:outer membrane protein assembly factor BamD
MKNPLSLLLVVLFALLAACSSNDVNDEEMAEAQIYREAQRALKDENFGQAVKYLQMLESRFPFGPYAEQAQLELIYAHYRAYEEEAAIAAADRFIRLHPQHPSVDYAYYMKGLANYTAGTGILERFLPTDMTQRDPGKALQSFEDFRQLLYRFPDSSYAADAKARMIYLRARLARYEINVANYYFRRKAYMAAANRGRYVVENYPQTEAVPDALAVMVQAYQLLGLADLSNDALVVLKNNHPQHPSIDGNGEFISAFTLEGTEKSTSWVSILTLGLFDREKPPAFDNRADYLKY